MLLLTYLIEHNRYMNLIGICVVLFIAMLFSRKRGHINYRLIVSGLALEALIGFLVLRTNIGNACVQTVSNGVAQLYQFADAGSSFVFGGLADAQGPWGFVFAFKVLPIIIFFGAFMGVLFHFGVVQRIVWLVSLGIRPLLGTSGPETLCAIANSFLGQTEAPLLIRHYLKNLTKSEMLVVMVSGMGTISGAILVVFAAIGVPAQHLLSASVMAIPGSIVIAKILLPETEKAIDKEDEVDLNGRTSNVFDAIASGTSDGLMLALNVGAMLVAFLGLLAFVNALLAVVSTLGTAAAGAVGSSYVFPELSLQGIFCKLLMPLGYLFGFEGADACAAGELIGIKVAVNEMVAYIEMVKKDLPERVVALMTYALCGFSNFSCIGIQIGGIGALVPERRSWLTQLGLYAVLGGALTNILSAMFAGLLL